MNPDVLDKLEEIGLKKVFMLLLSYSNQLMKYRKWQHGKNCATKGEEAADFASNAIEKALKSKWDKVKFPTIMDRLKSVLKNEIGNSLRLKSNLTASNVDIVESAEKLSDRYNNHVPDKMLESEQAIEIMRNLIISNKKDEFDKITEVFNYIEEGYQNIEIAEMEEISVNDVNNYKKRIRRLLDEYQS